jgi:predicted enzyme related to lactoylglutathione lyase
MTRDLEAPKTFYGEVFGWTAEDMPMGDGAPPYTVFKNGERMICGMMAMDSSFPAGVPNAWAIYFAVDGTDAACEKAVALGGHVHVPPTDIPPGRFALLVDPQGAMFNIITFGAPPDDPNVG